MKSVFSRKTLFGFLLALFFINSNSFADDYRMKVGVSCPLTGDLAEYGSAVRNGIELARESFPKSLSSIDFIYEDNQYDAAMAVTAFNKLRSVDNVSLIYNWGEPTLGAIASIAEKGKLPIIAMSLDPEPARNKKFIIRSINYSEQYAIALLNYLRTKKYKKIGIIKTEDPFLNSMISGLEKNLKPDETLKVAFSFNPGETDFKTAISKIKTENFDVLGVYLFTGQVSSFYRQAGVMGLKIPTFGTDFFESKTEIADAKGFMSGAVYPNIDVPESFASAYLKKYNNDIQVAYAYNAFEMTKLVGEKLGDLKEKQNPQQLINSFLKLSDQNHLRFKIERTFDGDPYYSFKIVIKEINANDIKVVQ
jgi:branched-chain amino acid transport system substrate-binding protein